MLLEIILSNDKGFLKQFWFSSVGFMVVIFKMYSFLKGKRKVSNHISYFKIYYILLFFYTYSVVFIVRKACAHINAYLKACMNLSSDTLLWHCCVGIPSGTCGQ